MYNTENKEKKIAGIFLETMPGVGKTQEQIDKEIAAAFDGQGTPVDPTSLVKQPEGKGGQEDQSGQQGQAGQGGGQHQQQQQIQTNWFADELQNRIKVINKDFALPEELTIGKTKDGKELTQQERFDKALEIIYQNTKYDGGNQLPEDINDPFILKYLADKKNTKDFDFNTWIKGYSDKRSILNVQDNKEFYSKYLKSKNYSDEAISNHLEKINEIDLDEKANAIRANLKSQFDKEDADLKNSVQFQQPVDINAIKQTVSTQVKSVLDKAANFTSDDFGGLPYSKTDYEEFKPKFEELMTINEKTGLTKADEYFLSDNNILYKALYLLSLTDSDKMKNYVSSIKEENKQAVLKKLRLKPDGKGSFVSTGITPPDNDKLV